MKAEELRDVSYNIDLSAVSNSDLSDRGFVASLLLDAVEQSLQIIPCTNSEMMSAREWLRGAYAQALMILIDINPEAAMSRLQRKWAALDAKIASREKRLH